MPIDTVVAPLLRVPLFAGLEPAQLSQIARHAERIRFRSGGVIIRAGEAGDAAYLIVSGRADRMPDAVSRVREPVEPGSLLGEMAMLVEHIYGATVVAADAVRCLKISRTAMHAQMRNDPTLAEHLQQRITQRLLGLAHELRAIDQAILSSRNTFDRLVASAR
jgi:CRP-like cAMP-binding protein